MIIFDLNPNTYPRCGFNTIAGYRNIMCVDKVVEKVRATIQTNQHTSYDFSPMKQLTKNSFHKTALYLQIRFTWIQNDT